MNNTVTTTVQKSCIWLLDETLSTVILTPENILEEHQLIKQTAREFVNNEVLDSNEQLETKDWELAKQLLRRCGELGLLGTDVPEKYGGNQLDKISSAIIASQIGYSGSFSATFGAQTGLTILPIALFGTEKQKAKYLPKLVSGEWVGAYCLSETESGSDALNAKTRAIRNEDGDFILNGEKMWITNGGFADLYIVFAKIDGEHFTAFIVERGFIGVSSGKEEQKMGLLGSSTTPVILQDVKVPAKNILGEVGKGHKVAFNILNYGRFKLGASTVGGSREAITEAVNYATQRYQFSKPISSFGAIQHKLGEMTIRAYAIESMVYRTAGLLDAAIKGHENDEKRLLALLEEYAIEASILKVAGSEALQFILDENMQIHGGNGYVKDYPAERHYRDSRVNRIFEGTNEINRLLITGMLAKRVLEKNFPLEITNNLERELINSSPLLTRNDGLLESQQDTVKMFKKIGLILISLAIQTYKKNLTDQQEVLSFTSDVLIDIFASESMMLRALQAAKINMPNAELQAKTVKAFISDSVSRIDFASRSAISAMIEANTLPTYLSMLRHLLTVDPVNTVAIRRQLANATVERGAYIF